MQRFFDIILSGVAIIVLLPLLLPVALILRFTGEGEIFFLQSRIGKDGTSFNLYKFATMLKDSPSIGTGTVTVKGDPRVLPFGRILRKSKINELPQLLNIFLGDMSVVGPRPQTPRCFSAFPRNFQLIIQKVRPGLSGIGPIVFRSEEDLLANKADSLTYYDTVIAPYKGSVEAWYVDHQTLLNYFLIIGSTIWVVVRPKSSIVWKIFKGLPPPPGELADSLNYPA